MKKHRSTKHQTDKTLKQQNTDMTEGLKYHRKRLKKLLKKYRKHRFFPVYIMTENC